MVPAFEEAAEVLAAALLTIALAQRLPQRVAVPHQRQVAEGHEATHPVADRVAQVEVEDAVEAVVLVQRADAGQVGSSEGQQIVLQGVDDARLTAWRLFVRLAEVAHVRGQQSEGAGGTHRWVCQNSEDGAEGIAGELEGGVEEDDDLTATGAQSDIAAGSGAWVVVHPHQSDAAARIVARGV